MKRQRDHAEYGALIALFAGALSTGGAGILVRLAQTGPTATAFWRGFLALPLLAAWALLEPARGGTGPGQQSPAGNVARLLSSFRDPGFLLAGVFFAGDLALWHWSAVADVYRSLHARGQPRSPRRHLHRMAAVARASERCVHGRDSVGPHRDVVDREPEVRAGRLGFSRGCARTRYCVFLRRLPSSRGPSKGALRYRRRDVQLDSCFHGAAVALGAYSEVRAGHAVRLGNPCGMRVGRAGAGAGAHSVCAGAPAADVQLVRIAGADTRCGRVGVVGVGRALVCDSDGRRGGHCRRNCVGTVGA